MQVSMFMYPFIFNKDVAPSHHHGNECTQNVILVSTSSSWCPFHHPFCKRYHMLLGRGHHNFLGPGRLTTLLVFSFFPSTPTRPMTQPLLSKSKRSLFITPSLLHRRRPSLWTNTVEEKSGHLLRDLRLYIRISFASPRNRQDLDGSTLAT